MAGGSGPVPDTGQLLKVSTTHTRNKLKEISIFFQKTLKMFSSRPLSKDTR
jgi:hypothetical protein